MTTVSSKLKRPVQNINQAKQFYDSINRFRKIESILLS